MGSSTVTMAASLEDLKDQVRGGSPLEKNTFIWPLRVDN